MVAITNLVQSTLSPVASSPSVDVRQASSPLPQQVAQMPQPQVQAEKPTTEQDVKRAVAQANQEMASLAPTETIGFGYVEKLNQIFVQVKDSKTGEVIREIPSKDFIKHKLAMREMIGLILDKQA